MASTYLTRTNGTATNNKICTFSAWLKLASDSSYMRIFTAQSDVTGRDSLYILSGELNFYQRNGTTSSVGISGDRLFRDTSAWYHLVVACDSTQATASNRIKIYLNGEQQTLDGTQIPQNQTFAWNENNLIAIGADSDGSPSEYFNGSMSHIHFIDGTAYDASAFGSTDATTGIWKPKTAPSVTYGTNGFFLKFENSASMGTDSSGNANNFTVNGTMTQNIDTPSNVFATLNPLASGVAIGGVAGTFANGNTFFSGASAAWCTTKGTIPITQGKYYFEAKKVTNANGTANGQNNVSVGFAELQSNLPNNNPQNNSGIYGSILVVNDNGWTTNFANGTQWSTPQAVNDGDIVGIALDLNGNNYTFYVNGTQVDTGSLGAGYDGNGLTPCLINYGGDTKEFYCNFGNGYFGTTAVASAQNPDDGIGIFEYSVPTGYKALCTKSINAQEYS